MELSQILRHVDHTLLDACATEEEIRDLCDDAIAYGCASVCIPPAFVASAHRYVAGRMKICTVIGFPLGYSTTEVKVFEAEQALSAGADEIDMVINLGWVKEGRFDKILSEIKAVRQVTEGHVLKVIIETCRLSDEEKIELCRVVSASGADYIKTSTGFSTGGATFTDVKLFSEHVAPGVKIKAAGGISSLEDAEMFLNLGADRLGTSRIVRLAKEAAKECAGESNE